ncbi:MAG: integrase family protein [Chromatiaceae bacterium]|nr:integrase family protein [Chromatiaceae bacterium]
MGKRLNFTQATIDALAPADAGKRDYYNDAKVPGLQLQVTANGVKTYYVYRRINGRPTRVKLGRHPDMSAQKARNQAQQVVGEIAAGGNPVARKRRERVETVMLADAFEEFLRVRRLKEKTVYDYRRIIEGPLKDWKGKQLQRLTKDMVARRHAVMGRQQGEAYANLVMRVLRSVYNFALSQYEEADGNPLLPPNPVGRLSATRAWFKDKRRDRYLREAELPAWFKAVLAYKRERGDRFSRTVADYLLFMVFTGLRRSEAASLQWRDVDLAGKTFTVRDTKNGEDHTLPLSDYLLQLLEARRTLGDGVWVFASEHGDMHLKEPRKHMQAICEAAEVPFTLHDLRRTFVTYAERLDISAYAVKRLVNHKLRQDVTAGYIGVDVERLRKPMQAITDFLLKAGKVAPGNVVPMAREGQS